MNEMIEMLPKKYISTLYIGYGKRKRNLKRKR